MRRARGFSLLEVIVALGVLAVGASAAFALLVAAAAAGKRAEHQVNAAMLAETLLNDSTLEPGVRLTDYPLVADAPAVAGEDRPPGERLPSQAAGLESRYLVRDQGWTRYPGYKYDLVITPIPGPVPDEFWQFLLEVEVRWSQKGRRRAATFQTVRLRTPTHLEPPAQRP